MTMHNLDRNQNLKLADLLLGAAKAIVVASVVAFLYPPSGTGRSVVWLVAGCGVAAILAVIGLALAKGEDGGRKDRRGGR